MGLPLLTLLTVAIGLAIDALLPDLRGHWIANGFVAVCWLVAFRLATRAERRSLVACVLLATAGELFLCFVWGLYEYRHGNLPPFVPLGHSMIFLTGCRIAPRMPPITWRLVVLLATPAVIALAALGIDTGGVLWYPLFLACLLIPRMRTLYGVMFAMALLVEIAGTQVGSWAWSAQIPLFGLRSTNPPLCAGVFYCVLDVLVLGSERLREHWRHSRAAA